LNLDNKTNNRIFTSSTYSMGGIIINEKPIELLLDKIILNLVI